MAVPATQVLLELAICQAIKARCSNDSKHDLRELGYNKVSN